MTCRRLHLGLVALVVAAVHAAIFFTEPTHGTFDTDSYLVPARALAAQHAFLGLDHVSYPMDQMYGGPTTIKPETIRTPGYPLLLMLTGISVVRVVALQHLLDLLLALGIYLFVERTTGAPRAAFFAALVYGCDPPVVELANQCMSDQPFTFVLALATAAVFFAIEKRSVRLAIAAGLLLGASVMVRPISVYLFLPLTLVMLWRTRRPLVAAAFCIAALALPSAWVARNASRAGVATISSISGDNALFFRAAGVLATEGWRPLDVVLAQQRHADALHTGIVRIRPQLLRAAEATTPDFASLNHAQRARIYTRLAVPIVLAHVPRVIGLMVSGTIELYLFAIPPLASVGALDFAAMRLLLLPGNAALLALAIAGALALRRVNVALLTLLLTVVIYLTIVSVDVEVGYRFAVPIAPMYAILIGAGLDQLLARARARRDGNPGPS